MSASETLYTFRLPYQTVLARGREQVSDWPVWRSGVLVEPELEGSDYVLYDPVGNVVAEPEPELVGGVLSVTLTAAMLPATLAYGENYREAWTFELPDGSVRRLERLASVGRSDLYPVISVGDVDAEYPDASADFDGARTQAFMDEAWKRIIGRIRQDGRLPYLIATPDAFRDAHRELTNYLRFKWLHVQAPGSDRWKVIADEHRAAYEAAWPQLTFALDEDQDGRPDNLNRVGMGQVVHVNAAPGRRVARDPRF